MAPIPRPTDLVAARINEWWEGHKREEPRPHLGASLLGHPCERWLWLSFRWAVQEKHEGRMLRLFDRGKREEQVIVRNLRNIGINIHNTCLNDGGQVRVELAPHVGGSVDGIIDGGVPGAEKTRHIAEFKTHNLRSFNELKAKGVFEAKRRHWCQMQCYMHGTKINRALYVAVCKDNDEIYTERVEYNPQAANDIINRGARIVLEEHLPPMMKGAGPAWYECKMCPAWSFCHETHRIEPDCVNCRTCAHVTPKDDGTWVCENAREFFAGAIKADGRLAWLAVQNEQDQRDGCARHVLHPDLVPWPMEGADEFGNGIYNVDGKRVINGGQGNGTVPAVLSANLLAGETEPREEADIPF